MQTRSFAIPVVAFSLLAIAGAWMGGDWLWLHYLGKPLATVCILLFAASVQTAVSPRYRGAVLAGLGLSLVGDVLLMLPMDAFLPGLVAFLIAHVFYIAAFASGSSPRARVVSFLPWLVIAGANLAELLPRIDGALRGPVLAYVAVLVTMAALAMARLRTPALAQAHPHSVRYAAAGGACFVVSDSLLAWDRFAGGVPLSALLVLSTYWIAQWCIAQSVRAR